MPEKTTYSSLIISEAGRGSSSPRPITSHENGAESLVCEVDPVVSIKL